jgi:hypothetical protein
MSYQAWEDDYPDTEVAYQIEDVFEVLVEHLIKRLTCPRIIEKLNESRFVMLRVLIE